MENEKDMDRKKHKKPDGRYDDEYRRERKSKRTRTRSRSPPEKREKDNRKRRRSKSRSQERPVKQEKQGNDVPNEPQKEPPARKAKETDMLNTRTGGAYIPPARLRMMQAQITDKSSVAYQRLAWEALKKSIHGHINKINVGNIGIIIKELLKENIVRGRGLLCRSVIQAQAASPTFTNVYAALVAAVNSRFPNIGELLLKRLVIQFKRGFKRNDKPTCISSASFIAHLVNQRVAHEILALELLTLLVETPTDDSVEVAIAFLKECGQKLTEVSSKGVSAIFEMLRNILHEGQLDKRVQYMIEVMFQVWKDGFKDHPALIEELELVPEEEQFTHLLMLDEATDSQDILNVFKFDDKYEENEQKYKTLSKEILGSDAESGEEDGSEESGSEESEEEEQPEGEQKGVTIIDNTETNLVALRRTIYLTINSSLDFEECAHKLLKMELKPGQEVELCHMFLDCCAEQRTYEKFYGLLAQRFCNINRMYIGPFEEIFKDSYATAHRLDTNRLRNVSKFFAHLLFTDSISWEVLECVKLNEEDTTSSSRIYIKILFQELAEYMGLKKLNDRLKDPTLQTAFSSIFPRDNPKNTRFSINFFTSIGLGGLTDELREHLKQMPKNVPAPITEINLGSEDSSSDSSSSSSSSSSDSSSSDSDSEEEVVEKKKSKNKKKSKSPKTPDDDESDKNRNNDRWGHDGFYDTYGKDARRKENRPEVTDKDDANFIRPRDVARRNEERYRERSYEHRNVDKYKKRDERNNREDSRRNRDERDDRWKDKDSSRQDGSRSRDDERYRDRSREHIDDSNSRRYSERERSDKRQTEEEPKRKLVNSKMTGVVRRRIINIEVHMTIMTEIEETVMKSQDQKVIQKEKKMMRMMIGNEKKEAEDKMIKIKIIQTRKEIDISQIKRMLIGNSNKEVDRSDSDTESYGDRRKRNKDKRINKEEDRDQRRRYWDNDDSWRSRKDKPRDVSQLSTLSSRLLKLNMQTILDSKTNTKGSKGSNTAIKAASAPIVHLKHEEVPVKPQISAPSYFHSLKENDAPPFVKPEQELRPKLLIGTVMSEVEAVEMISAADADRYKGLQKYLGTFLVKKNIVPNYNISETNFLISFLMETIDYAAQHDFNVSKLACLISIYIKTHLYFKSYYWLPPIALWDYFKETMIRHTVEDPPDGQEVFEPDECYDILTHFHTIYLSNLPLIHILTFGAYRLKITWPYKPKIN
ncbi:pre-mRNA-splicing factor CWC22 homolog [Galleria mellonella]|uniref:Pre-mRNA-splicing factor CWC22 homolog n=1 Tax=Galleria mellonella TaxID=7137 RepID=A0ABM3N2L9_GALME|nr:pre-mRNA-splicing factor CWC22 homolog [Galleria mellonella]